MVAHGGEVLEQRSGGKMLVGKESGRCSRVDVVGKTGQQAAGSRRGLNGEKRYFDHRML